MSKNIAQLYFENGKKLPFIIRRESWNNKYGLLVKSVNPYQSGFGLPPLDGSESTGYWAGEIGDISCSGCYQWILITDIPSQWLQYI